MSRYRLTGPARADLREIWNYVASHSERRADRLQDEFYARRKGIPWEPTPDGQSYSNMRFYYTPGS